MPMLLDMVLPMQEREQRIVTVTDNAESVAALERVRDELKARFTSPEAGFNYWTLELLSIVETALAQQFDGNPS